MVRVTIYVEGGTMPSETLAQEQASGAAAKFREGFHKLFSQILDPNHFDLVVQPIGSVSQARRYLEKINQEGSQQEALLIDLDADKTAREARIASYGEQDTSKLFFMIQEMEAWILSQTDKIELYCKDYQVKNTKTTLANNPLIRDKNPEDIVKPSEKLDTLLSQHYEKRTERGGKIKYKALGYHKTKDGPALLALLDLSALVASFDEAERLIAYLSAKD